MSGDLTEPVLLVGTGPMAESYLSVLAELGAHAIVVGRSSASAARFLRSTGHAAIAGGIEAWLDHESALPHCAVVATSVDQLEPVTRSLVTSGVTRVLVEKPGALDASGLEQLATIAADRGAEVHVAYNRRYYASVMEVRRRLEDDGGVISFAFDFTELAERVGASSHPSEVKQRWVLANSSHVIDLAFFLGGQPVELNAAVSGSLPWHPSAARFAGHGLTSRGAMFAYFSDWEAPGRWGLEVATRDGRYVLRPLERLAVQSHGSFDVVAVPLEDQLDRRFKPGLLRATKAFLERTNLHLPTLDEHARFVRQVVEPIAGVRQ